MRVYESLRNLWTANIDERLPFVITYCVLFVYDRLTNILLLLVLRSLLPLAILRLFSVCVYELVVYALVLVY